MNLYVLLSEQETSQLFKLGRNWGGVAKV